MKVKIIAAVSKNGVIGKNNSIPWNYPEDMKFFKAQTRGCQVVMGKKTFKSMGSKPLPNRENIIIQSLGDVVEKSKLNKDKITDDNCHFYSSVFSAIEESKEKKIDTMWLIGGAKIYEEGLNYADEIYLTLIPDYIKEDETIVKFPFIDPTKFKLEETIQLENSELKVAKLVRI